MKSLTISALPVLILFTASLSAQLADGQAIKTESGLLSSSVRVGRQDRVSVFRGIPYAAPPVGEGRWAPPGPVQPWTDVRDASRFAPTCPQSQALEFEKREDCLYLNLWTAARSGAERRPVMVWIHGGGFHSGSGNLPIFDGTRFAEAGVVLVTFNYRLNVLGSFAHPLLTRESPHQASGNYGLMDMVAALKWVQRNIAVFGGDPKRVTVFGESAGGRAVAALMVSPLSEGLFQRAIAQSGATRDVSHSLESRERMGVRMGAALGCDREADPLACLRSRSWEELSPVLPEFESSPTVDGWVVPVEARLVFARGQQHDVPLLLGSNQHEAALSVKPGDPGTRSVDDFEATIRKLWGRKADPLFTFYYPGSDAEAFQTFIRLRTDTSHTMPARAMARWMSNVRSPAYLYHFTRTPPDPRIRQRGAAHATELRYVFQTLDQEGGIGAGGLGDPSLLEPADRRLSDAMMGYWTQFAAVGNPNREGLPRWPAYEPGSDRYLELGAEIKSGEGLYRRGLDLLELLMLEKYMEAKRPVLWAPIKAREPIL